MRRLIYSRDRDDSLPKRARRHRATSIEVPTVAHDKARFQFVDRPGGGRRGGGGFPTNNLAVPQPFPKAVFRGTAIVQKCEKCLILLVKAAGL
jgi:hypothetical protein